MRGGARESILREGGADRGIAVNYTGFNRHTRRDHYGKMADSEVRTSTLQPFAAGDVFVGATLLNDPDDDHAGLGRILQYDAELNLRGQLWVTGTTHLVYGLSISPQGEIWAFDPWAWLAIRVNANAQQLPNRRFASRALSKVHFAADGSLWFTESLGGDNQPEPLTTRHRPLPGHDTLLGEAGLYHYTPDGELLGEFHPEFHGGMSGSMAITHSVLAPDGHTLIYASETGPRLMRFDLDSGEQLDDLQHFPDGRGQMFFDLALTATAQLLVCRGDRVEVLDLDGKLQRNYPLEGFGWSVIGTATPGAAFVANWFSGEVVRLDLATGDVTASVSIAPKCIAGLAQYSPA